MPDFGRYQDALYRAQDASIGRMGRYWNDIRDVRSYVDSLVASDWFQNQWPHVLEVNVERRGSGSTWSCASESDMTIYLAELTQDTVLHEVAHLCVGSVFGHNPRFARCLLMLVRREMGAHAYGDLLYELRYTEAFRDADLNINNLLEV